MQSLVLDPKKLRKLSKTKDPFASLVRSIISQQLSTKSADSIQKKFVALFPTVPFPAPRQVLKLSDVQFASAGVSPQKRAYIRDLAQKFTDGTIDQKGVYTMDEVTLREHLLQVRGIGPWTVDMFLIFALNRKDVLPIGDLGIMKGFQKVFGLKKIPSAKVMEKLAEPYKGKRTYLSLYLWQSLDGK